MTGAAKISITLTPAMNRLIKRRVDSGDFASSSEVIREALRVWSAREEERRERLASMRARIRGSLDDPRPSVSLKEARARVGRHMAKRRRPAK